MSAAAAKRLTNWAAENPHMAGHLGVALLLEERERHIAALDRIAQMYAPQFDVFAARDAALAALAPRKAPRGKR